MTESEKVVREFAREYPTLHVLSAVNMAEAGTLKWTQLEDLFKKALIAGMREVG